VSLFFSSSHSHNRIPLIVEVVEEYKAMPDRDIYPNYNLLPVRMDMEEQVVLEEMVGMEGKAEIEYCLFLLVLPDKAK
jgi:hypothetical protein